MAKKKFGAAKYTDLPEEHYLVVINPWGMVSGRPRGMRDAQCCAAWLRGVFGVEIEGLVEAIFMMDTVSHYRRFRVINTELGLSAA
jgi:hypothetical protein